MSNIRRFPKCARKRFADLILRRVYQSGGRTRYVPVQELEDELGLETWRILAICRKELLGEIHIAWRLPVEVTEGMDCWTAAERLVLEQYYSRAHVRIRPDAVRLTEQELVPATPARKRKKKQKKNA